MKNLFDTAVARKNDPITSHAAADAVNQAGLIPNHHARIMAVLDQAVEPLTPRAIACKSGLTYHQVQRRIGELQKKGKIGSDGIRDGCRCWSAI